MQRIDEHLTPYLFDSWGHVGPRRKKALETSWAYFFRENLLTAIPVRILAHRFSEKLGRPSKETYAMLGALVLQQIFNLTDEETLHRFMFDDLWHYALDIHDQSDDSMYLCERTLRHYRSWLCEQEGAADLFAALTGKLLDHFAVPTDKQRMDSTHLFSNMKRLRRLDLFRETLVDFLGMLKKMHRRLFRKHVSQEMAERYLGEKNGCFSRVTGEEARTSLEQAARDLLFLARTFEGHAVVSKRPEFGLLARLLQEQCEIEAGGAEGEEERIVLKEPKDLACDILQNPSDPDATYDGHKGPGYQAQILETYQTEAEPAAPNLITYVHVEAAHEADADAVRPAIEETKARDCAPEALLGDTAFGSDDNVQAAQKEEVELIAPAPGEVAKAKEMLVLRDFTLAPETQEIVHCPAGHAPEETTVSRKDPETPEGDKHTARFAEAHCRGCEMRDYCQAGLDPKHRMQYTDKQARLEERRFREAQPEFKETYRMRSGIEATNAQLKKLMPGGRVRVRGLRAVRFAVTLKALGVNIQRAVHWPKKRKQAGKSPFFGSALLDMGESFLRRIGFFLRFLRVGRSDTPGAPAAA